MAWAPDALVGTSNVLKTNDNVKVIGQTTVGEDVGLAMEHISISAGVKLLFATKVILKIAFHPISVVMSV